MSNQVYSLNTGGSMPIVSYGTFKIRKEEMHRCIEVALNAGYRSIDTASVYRNESAIGSMLMDLLKKVALTRDDIFITSKLGPKDQGCTCKEAIRKSLSDLKVDYLDLYLIHWPGVQKIQPQDPSNRQLRKESWLQMEEMYGEGKLKAIGVSNYNLSHMQDLLSYATVMPAILQNECHPHLQQGELIEFCKKHGILFQAYSSLGTSSTEKHLLQDEIICRIAKECKRSPAQVLLKWALQNNLGVIPKSTNDEHIRENINLFDFELSLKQMQVIRSLDRDKHYAWNPAEIL